MSYLLRHGSCNESIQIDSQGYVSMTALFEWLNKDLHQHLNMKNITWIVDNNDMVRFSIDTVRGVKSKYGDTALSYRKWLWKNTERTEKEIKDIKSTKRISNIYQQY